MKHNHTKREKGQALFLAALMVLSVFAMSASFAGAAAAAASGVTAENVNSADDPTESDIVVTHDEADTNASIVIAPENDDDYDSDNHLFFQGSSADDETTTEFVEDIDALEDGTYTVYAVAGDSEVAEPSNGDLSTWADEETNFEVQVGSISGTVTDVETGDAIEDATVEVEGSGLSTDTNADGNYTIENAPDGEHTVVADASTFVSSSQTVNISDGGETDGTNFALEPRDADIEVPAEGLETADDFYEGQQVDVTGFDSSTTVELHSGTDTDGDAEDFLRADGDGVVTVDTTDLDGPHMLEGDAPDGTDSEFGPFWVVQHDATIEFESDTVSQSNTTLNYESDRSDNVDLEISSDELDGDDLQDIFGDDYNTDDDVITVTDVSPESDDNVNADFSDIDTGEYNFTVSVADTTAEEDLSIEVTESIDADASFDSSTYSQTAGDIVEFTVEMEGGVDEATVDLMEDDDNYNATLTVVDNEGDGEVNVSFNTYNAGQGDDVDNDSVFWANDGNEVSVENETDFQGDFRLLPGDFNLELLVNDDDETDVASLILTERSTGDVEPGIAPADSEIEDADDIDNVTTTGSEVAEDDLQIIGFDINGIFGLFDGDDLTAADIDDNDYFDVEIEHTNPGSYENAHEIGLDEVDVVTDSEDDRMFFVIDTAADADIEAGQNYEVSLTVDEDYYNMDDDEEAETSFDVVDREIAVTGDFDEDDRLQVENGEEVNVTGESTAAPGTDVQTRLRATGDDPFLMTETAEVDSNGVVDTVFDLSDHEEGQNFTVRMTDQHDNDVQDEVDAVLVESTTEQDPHTVTITVEDADGEPVEDAEVEVDGQTETTDANGEAVFSLHHGEYDISATYDGEEATGTLTVDDETSDSGTLILGEEDQQIPEEDPADENGDTDPSDENGDVDPDDENGDADPDDEEDPEDEDQPGFGIAVALIALLAAAGIALRNRA